MDFNQILEIIKPYLTDTAVIGGVIGVIASAIKVYNVVVKKAGKIDKVVDLSAEKIDNKLQDLSETFKNSMPKSLTIDVKPLVETALKDYVSEFKDLIDIDVTETINDLTNKCDLILRTLGCLKSIPDTLKNEINAQLKAPEETHNIVVELTSSALEAETLKVEEESTEIPIM